MSRKYERGHEQIYAPAPVKTCHHPWSSKRNDQGIPMLRLTEVKELQIILSTFQMAKPVTKMTAGKLA